MSQGEDLRRFFRREHDELTIHERGYPAHLRLLALHGFGRLCDDPDVEVVELTNYGGWPEDSKVAVHWESVRVSHGDQGRYMSEATLFAIHRRLGDLLFVVRICPLVGDGVPPGGTALRVCIRTEDGDTLPDLLEWMDELERREHPLRGKTFSLGGGGLKFLPEQAVAREDLILPAGALDEVERNLAFLDDPGSFPRTLRHRAVLLAGRPGVGKTMLAKWLSGRFTCTVLWATPGAVWGLGVGEVFGLAQLLRPSLLVLEDLDVAAGDRNGMQPLGDLLGYLDGFEDLTDVAIVATTNQPEVLDQAINPSSRPGRFHCMVLIEPPDAEHREVLLGRLIERSEVLGDLDQETREQLVRRSHGATGAQITEMVRDLESRVLWQRRNGRVTDAAEVVRSFADARSAVVQVTCGFRCGDR